MNSNRVGHGTPRASEFMRSQAEGKDLPPLRRKERTAQFSGLALIEQLYFGIGYKAAQEQMQRLLGGDSRPFAVSESGQASTSVHFSASDEGSLQDFSPPSHWNVAYSIQFARLRNKEKDDYLFYPGEQILIPVEGEIQYHFFWSPGGRTPERILLSQPVTKNSILRINPQIPHHAWSLHGDATGWYALRHAANSPAALVMDQTSASMAAHRPEERAEFGLADSASLRIRSSPNRRVRTDDLQKAGAYAMIVWGISGAVREARLRTGMTTTELAARMGIDPSTLSRLEEAKANVSIDMLLKVCRALHIGVADRLESGSWVYDVDTINSHPNVQDGAMLEAPIGYHALHPYLVRLPSNRRLSVATTADSDAEAVASWIVLEGKVLAHLPAQWGGRSVIVSAGSVIHFREPETIEIQALVDSKLVHIVHSRACRCKDQVAATLLEGSA
jgi:transcriptional regulator with XRE-family HTH domain